MIKKICLFDTFFLFLFSRGAQVIFQTCFSDLCSPPVILTYNLK